MRSLRQNCDISILYTISPESVCGVKQDITEFTLVSRAFGEIESFVDACRAFVDYGAEVYLMKSQLTQRELEYLDKIEYPRIHNINNSPFDKRVLVNFKRYQNLIRK